MSMGSWIAINILIIEAKALRILSQSGNLVRHSDSVIKRIPELSNYLCKWSVHTFVRFIYVNKIEVFVEARMIVYLPNVR